MPANSNLDALNKRCERSIAQMGDAEALVGKNRYLTLYRPSQPSKAGNLPDERKAVREELSRLGE